MIERRERRQRSRLAPAGRPRVQRDRALAAPRRRRPRGARDPAAPSCTRRSTGSRSSSSAGCLPKRLPEVRGRRAGRPLRGGRRRRARSAATGTTRSRCPDGRLGIVLGDVTGSGIRAASAMGQLRSVTRAFALAGRGRTGSPDEVLIAAEPLPARARRRRGLFTLIYAIIDPAAGHDHVGQRRPSAAAAARRRRARSATSRRRRRADGHGGGAVRVDSSEPLGPAAARSCCTPTGWSSAAASRSTSASAGWPSAVRAGPDEPQRAVRAHPRPVAAEPDEQLHDDVTAVVARLFGANGAR